MHRPSKFSVRGRIRSFGYAIRGIWTMLRTQHNAWIHVVATVMVGVAGIWFQVSRAEWGLLVMAIVAVWVAEALNTGLELLCDALQPEEHPLVGQAKDVAAGGVLIAAMGALGVGLLVFLPRFLHF